MSRYHSYLNSAEQIVNLYKGEEPLASFLKKFFSENKKYGSRDRKQISHLCYCYFRIGKINVDMPVSERIVMGLFLCSGQPNEILQELKPGWNDKVYLSLKEKYSIFNNQSSILNVFPWKDELSDGIDHEKFCESFFIQPDLFLRLRPGKEEAVKNKLQTAGIDFEIISESCLALSNSSKLDEIIEMNKEAVVQDYSSQRTGDFFQSAISNLKSKISAWDCCAGSGGKSIMLYDYYPGIDLTVSDKRESIIFNLRKRFDEAGISKYKSLVADITDPRFELRTSNFELILSDVPCTGSGTWSRTPEQLFYFKKEKITEYAALQTKIVSNIIPRLKQNGYLLYITCSVFKNENEAIVEFVKQNSNLQLIKREVLKGYGKKADTMFAALLKKP